MVFNVHLQVLYIAKSHPNVKDQKSVWSGIQMGCQNVAARMA